MQKFLSLTALLSIIVLTGASCTSTPKDAVVKIKTNNAGVSYVAKPEDSSYGELFKTASAKAGFHIYYPTFIPENVAEDKNFVWNKTSAIITLSEDPLNTSLQSITIKQDLTNDTANSIKTRLEKLTAKENITINGHPGYYGIYEAGKNKFETVIFSTDDGVDVGVWSKWYPKNVLVHVAESLK